MASFTVMTWNVENLFPPGHQISPGKAVTQQQYADKLDYLAFIINEVVKPDVVALQEIGGGAPAEVPATLTDLKAKLNGFAHHAASKNPDGRGIRVAFLSKLPLENVEDIVAFPEGEFAQVPDFQGKPAITKMGRGAVSVEVEPTAGIRVRVVTTHLKSKLITYPGGAGGSGRFSPKDEDERARGVGLALLRRTAESVAVRTRLNHLMQGAPGVHTVVLGDLNDEPRAATTQLLLGPEDADASSPDKLEQVRLYNLLDPIPMRGDATKDKVFVPEASRYSRVYMGRRELIDHILVNRGLLGEPAAIKAGNWRVKEVRSVVESIEGVSITDHPSERVGTNRPDHAPVYARFEL